MEKLKVLLVARLLSAAGFERLLERLFQQQRLDIFRNPAGIDPFGPYARRRRRSIQLVLTSMAYGSGLFTKFRIRGFCPMVNRAVSAVRRHWSTQPRGHRFRSRVG